MTKIDNSEQPINVDIEDIKQSVLEAFKYIKVARKQIGLTIAELSKRTGVSVGVISELENEKRKDKKIPSLVNFIAITRALGMSKEFVLGLVLDYKLCDTSKNKAAEMADKLREYGIHDKESINFIMQTIEFVKNRTKNKNI